MARGLSIYMQDDEQNDLLAVELDDDDDIEALDSLLDKLTLNTIQLEKNVESSEK